MHILYLQHSSIQTDHISCAQWLHVAHGYHSEQQLIEGVNRIHNYNLRQVEVISSCPWTNGQWIHVGNINSIAFRHGKFILKLWISGLSKRAQQLLHITTCGYWNKHFHILPHLIFSKKHLMKDHYWDWNSRPVSNIHFTLLLICLSEGQRVKC